MKAWLVPALLLVVLPVHAEPVQLSFRINDALVKDRLLPGVHIQIRAMVDGGAVAAEGTTCPTGELSIQIEPGAWLASYEKEGYITVDSALEVVESKVITVSLTPLLERGVGPVQRRIAIVLNWGMDEDTHVRDADAYLGWEEGKQVYFVDKKYGSGLFRVSLDVDDMDWGGPETITLVDPPPGRYFYWVSNYSGPPETLGGSEVAVRVIIGDSPAGEYRISGGVDSEIWRPFEAIEVDQELRAHIVPFPPGSDQDRKLPDGFHYSTGCADCTIGYAFLIWLCFMAVITAIIIYKSR